MAGEFRKFLRSFMRLGLSKIKTKPHATVPEFILFLQWHPTARSHTSGPLGWRRHRDIQRWNRQVVKRETKKKIINKTMFPEVIIKNSFGCELATPRRARSKPSQHILMWGWPDVFTSGSAMSRRQQHARGCAVGTRGRCTY